jgi:hypothetical protein
MAPLPKKLTGPVDPDELVHLGPAEAQFPFISAVNRPAQVLGQFLGGGLHHQLVFGCRGHLDHPVHHAPFRDPGGLFFQQRDNFVSVLGEKLPAQGKDALGIAVLDLAAGGADDLL